MPKWECELCPYEVQDEDRDKVPALRDFHMRTKHGSDQVVPASGRKPKERDSEFMEAVGYVATLIFGKSFD